MTPSELLLAVDGGATKTQALVTDLEGNVLARGLGPGSNHHEIGFERFCGALSTAIEGAVMNILGPRAREAGPAWHTVRIAAACFGLAGVDAPEDEARISRWVKEQGIAPRFQVVNDSELILAGGTPEGWGVALICSAGSVCLGRSPDGRSARVGGWGTLLGDEGSGYQIALRALRLATQTEDGRANAPTLLRAVLRHWSLPNAHALFGHVYGPGKPEIVGLAGPVLDLAGRGDEAAAGIVNEAAADLALHVTTVIRKLGLKHPPLALAGGLLRGHLRSALLAALGAEVGPVHYVSDPSSGAVLLARRLLRATPPAG